MKPEAGSFAQNFSRFKQERASEGLFSQKFGANGKPTDLRDVSRRKKFLRNDFQSTDFSISSLGQKLLTNDLPQRNNLPLLTKDRTLYKNHPNYAVSIFSQILIIGFLVI